MSSFIIKVENTSGTSGTVIADLGFSYTDKLSEINQGQLRISGTGETKRGLFEVGSKVYIYRNGTLEFYGQINDISYLDAGGISADISGYEIWLAMENGDYASSPWSSTASSTIATSVIGESSYFSTGTINTGTTIDFRAEPTSSIWNVLSSLIKRTGQDIGIDYINEEVDILDHKGSSTSVRTFNDGVQISDLVVSHSYPIANDVRVYGKSEGETRIKSDYTSYGQDATSKTTYGTIRKIYDDPSITTESEANTLANALVAKWKDPIKVYEFEVVNPNQSLVVGDVITLNSSTKGLSQEEVRIVGIEKGVRNGKEFLSLQVTNAEYSELNKGVSKYIAEIEKRTNDLQNYDQYDDEYSNQNVDTTVGGFMTTDILGSTLNNVRQVANSGALTLGTTSGYTLYLIPSSGDYGADVQVWGHLDMYGGSIKNCGDLNFLSSDLTGVSSVSSTTDLVLWALSGDITLWPLGGNVDIHSDLDMFNNDILNVQNLYLDYLRSDDLGYIEVMSRLDMNGLDILGGNQVEADEVSPGTYDNLYLYGDTDAVIIGTDSWGGSYDDLYVSDDLDVGGSKNCVVRAKDGEDYVFSVIESPEVWFEEKISSKLENGIKEIILDERFIASTVIDEKNPIHAIAVPTSECENIWIEKKVDRIIVHSKTKDATFDVTISAKRLGFEDHRFDKLLYDEELETTYKESKKDLFLQQKPHRLKIKPIRDELKIKISEKKELVKSLSKEKSKEENIETNYKISNKNKEIKILSKQIKEISPLIKEITENHKKERREKWKTSKDLK